MEFREFEEEIFKIDRAIHREFVKNPAIIQAAAAKDSSELRAIVRRAAEDLVLCSDVDEGIRRLRHHPQAWSGIIALTVEAPLARDDHRSAAQHAFEATPREPNALPFYPYCSYLLALCSELDRAEQLLGPNSLALAGDVFQ
jgi:hypothetical protein